MASCAEALGRETLLAAQEDASEADVWSNPEVRGYNYVQTYLVPVPVPLSAPPVICDTFRTLCDCIVCVPRAIFPAVDLHMRTSVVLVGSESQREQQLAQKLPFGSRFVVDLRMLLRTMRACKAIGNKKYLDIDIPYKQANSVAYAGRTLPGKAEVPDWRSPASSQPMTFAGPLSYLGAAGEQFAAADAYYSGDKDAPASFLGKVIAEARAKSTSDPDVIREDVIAASSDPSAALPQAGADHGDGPARLAADPVIVYEDLYVGSCDGSSEVCSLCSSTTFRVLSHALPPYPVLSNLQGEFSSDKKIKDMIRAAQDLLIPREKLPPGEFEQNGANISETLPGLLPLGDDFRMQGSVPELTRRRLLLSYNPAFGSCAQLIFLLFNQLQRHTALRVLAGYVRNTPASFKAFLELSNDPNIRIRLEAAIANPYLVRKRG